MPLNMPLATPLSSMVPLKVSGPPAPGPVTQFAVKLIARPLMLPEDGPSVLSPPPGGNHSAKAGLPPGVFVMDLPDQP